MPTTNLSEITTLAELLEKVEEYRVTTSHMMVAHADIDEICWVIPNLSLRLVQEAARHNEDEVVKRGAGYCAIFTGPSCYIHAVSVPVE